MKIRIPQRRMGVIMFAMPDIAFLLLIFLILTVSVAENEDIDVPHFKFTQETEFPEVVRISIDKDGGIEVQGTKYPAEGLSEPLGRIGVGRVIHVIADGEVAYLMVDTVLSALRKAGLLDVILIAESDDKP